MERLDLNDPYSGVHYQSLIFGDFQAKSDEEIAEYERKIEEQKKQSIYENSGVGSKYFNCRLEDYETTTDEQKENLNKVRNFIKAIQNGENKTLWMCGKSGTGKTMLASLVVRECGGKFAKSYQIADEIEDSRSFSAKENKTALIKRYSEYKLLVIDEIGKFENKQGNELEYLFRILNERYEKENSTIIITNKTKGELKEYLGTPLFDRFVENCTSLDFNGDSYRKNKRA